LTGGGGFCKSCFFSLNLFFDFEDGERSERAYWALFSDHRYPVFSLNKKDRIGT